MLGTLGSGQAWEIRRMAQSRTIRRRDPKLRKQMVALLTKRAASKGAEWKRLDKEVATLQRKMDAVELA